MLLNSSLTSHRHATYAFIQQQTKPPLRYFSHQSEYPCLCSMHRPYFCLFSIQIVSFIYLSTPFLWNELTFRFVCLLTFAKDVLCVTQNRYLLKNNKTENVFINLIFHLLFSNLNLSIKSISNAHLIHFTFIKILFSSKNLTHFTI